jgi:hypothetical protein
MVTLADGSQCELGLVGFLNRAVIVDGRRYPLERRLHVSEYVLAGAPLTLVLTLGAIPVIVGVGGSRINTLLARSSLRRPGRIAAMLGVFVAAVSIAAVTVGLFGTVLFQRRETSPTTATWPYQTGECLAGPSDEHVMLDQVHAVDCSTPTSVRWSASHRTPSATIPAPRR